MNKNMWIMWVVSGLLMAGCATKPGYAGAWRCDELPQEVKEEGLAAATLYLTEEGGFSGAYENAEGSSVGGFSGTWTTNAAGGIDFVMTEGRGPEKGTGQLIDDNTMLGVGGGLALKFVRQ